MAIIFPMDEQDMPIQWQGVGTGADKEEPGNKAFCD